MSKFAQSLIFLVFLVACQVPLSAPSGTPNTSQFAKTTLSVEVTLGGTTGRAISDPGVTSVFVMVHDLNRNPVNPGCWLKKNVTTGVWSGKFDIPFSGNYTFSGWAEDSGRNNLYTGSTSVVITGDVSVTIAVEPAPSVFTLLPVNGGTLFNGVANMPVSSFQISRDPVTRAQFSSVMGSDPSDPAVSGGVNDPVQRVNWYQAVAFCNKLSVLEGKTPVYSVSGITDWAGLAFESVPTSNDVTWNAVAANWTSDGYRLPTETEHLWAAMGGLVDGRASDFVNGVNAGGYTKAYPGSSESGGALAEIGKYGWFSTNSLSKTHPVGAKSPNELGLYDVSGNVREWCWDWAGALPPAQADYRGPASGSDRSVRGGDWNSEVSSGALAARTDFEPSLQSNCIGLRVAAGISSNQYIVSYHANGATGGTLPSDATLYTAGTLVTALANAGNLVRSGYTFAGWNTASDGTGTPFAPGTGTFSIASSVLLWAQWTGSANGAATIATPPEYSVAVVGPLRLCFGSDNSYTSIYSGSPVSYAWYLDASLTPVGTSSTLILNPSATDARFGRGTHQLTLMVQDANGLTYAGKTAIVADNSLADLTSPHIGILKPVAGGTFFNGTANMTVSTFHMSQNLITGDQWAAVTGAPDPSLFASVTNHPVENVTWYDAVEFCNKLSLLEGKTPVYTITGRIPENGYPIESASVEINLTANGYRLPTEMESKWAAMGGLSDAKPDDIFGSVNWNGYNKAFAGSNGSNSIDNYVWYSANAGATTHGVGSKLPNELGLFDMSGNVKQWCWDLQASYPMNAQWDYSGPSLGTNRTVHGGAWLQSATLFSVNRRFSASPYYQFDTLGFRVATAVSPHQYHFSVSYDANGATAGAAPQDLTRYDYGSTVTVAPNSGNLALTNYNFAGWALLPSGLDGGYPAGTGTFTINQGTTLYAKWTGTVTFDGNGADGGAMSPQVFRRNSSAALSPRTLTRTGCAFLGWNTAPDGTGTNYADNASYTMAGNAILFAQWARMPLLASNGTDGDMFGSSVVISNDGSTMIVGARWADSGSPYSQGAAWVFTKSGNAWVQGQKLTASDAASSDYFGDNLAISSDGNTLVVGAYQKKIGSNTAQGAAYVFTRSGNTWTEAQKLVASDGAASDYFGFSSAISSDGTALVVGAYNKTVGSNTKQGAAYLFTKSGSTWSQAQVLTASDGAASDYFGQTVASLSDGNTLVVGAYGGKVGSNVRQGAAYVFTRSGGTWTQSQKLTALDGTANDSFGSGITVSADGGTLVIGASNKTIGTNSRQGAAYVFTSSGGTWNQAQRLTASDGFSNNMFGHSLGSSGDGSTLVIGATYYYGDILDQGRAYVFTKSGASWTQTQKLGAYDNQYGEGAQFGYSVATSGDGTTVAIGANDRKNGSNYHQGAVYPFSKFGNGWN